MVVVMMVMRRRRRLGSEILGQGLESGAEFRGRQFAIVVGV